MTTLVPESVIDAGAAIAALRSQEAALKAEREVVAGDYLAAMSALHESGDMAGLAAAIDGFNIVYGPGWAKRMSEAGLPDQRTVARTLLSICNDGEGRWRGVYPLEADALRPWRGTWVVYQLLSGDELLYIGSTGAFIDRIAAHARDKDFDSWRASECKSEAECRALETALIDRYRPPLNRMIPKPRVVLA